MKTRKYVRKRDDYDPTAFDQHAVDPDEIPADAPTHCALCRDELTPLRRLRPAIETANGPVLFCTKEDCLLAARHAKTANWRLVDLHKQGEELVIVGGGVINTSKRGV